MSWNTRSILFTIGALLLALSNKRPDNTENKTKNASTDHAQRRASETPSAELVAFHSTIRELHESEARRQEAGTAQLRTAKRLNGITLTAAIFNFLGFLAVAASVIVAKCAADVAHNALITANRAWISPITARIVSPINNVAAVAFEVRYKNTGKQPANHFAGPPQGEEFGSIKAPKEGQTWFDVFPANTINQQLCDTTKPDTGITVYPDTVHNYQILMRGTHLTPEMISGGRPFFLHGCYAYTSPVSGNVRNYSEYCFLFQRASADEVPSSCPHGNYAK